ncbi:MAG: hypothetical protein M0R75_06810 [Dehalococcoidia bacterium]|nr:hypothetical protein [Dehalococcoidia bacterium]
MSRSESWVQLTQEVTCEAPRCEHVFAPRVRVIRDTNGEEWSFRCPKCQKRYDMARVSARGVEVRAELRTVIGDTTMAAEEREARITELQAEMERETTRGADAGPGPSTETLQDAQLRASREGHDASSDD